MECLPMTIDGIKPYITDTSKPLIVDYQNSKLRSRTALIYCSNIGVTDIDISLENSPKTEVFELVHAYMSLPTVLKINSLINLMVAILLRMRRVDISSVDKQILGVNFTDDDIDEFLNNPNYQSTVTKLSHVLNSLVLYMLNCNDEYIAAFPACHKDNLVHVNDPLYTGVTFVHLLTHPVFVYGYYTTPFSSENRYFDHHFTQPIYSGRPLFHYFCQPENALIPLLDAILSGTITPDMLTSLQTRLKEQV